ncbi:nuclear transport factor 2 family protein [Streptomyces ficellus]|uniref:Nuclear transport factor 2 family protein n=1 Tax=Streptomyces ficellus TaxID=1977088 RepID=A0A6I6FRB2_9ACTN|nr:nuclear transport factor 2 family protein [Streptomyces ficellus]QGV82265.1 nuclear transport factor 2 family protein [Streptomyces ficellus]
MDVTAATEATEATEKTVERFRDAVEERDLAVLDELFTEDIRLYSPVKFTPFEGKAMVTGLFGVLLRTFEDFRYVGHFAGAAETSGDDGEAPAMVLLFRATVGGKRIHGIDLLHFDGAGRVKEFTVMVRPQSAVHALGEAVLAGLVADGLAPASP